MKLIYKFTLWYLLISLGVFFLGGIITYQVVKREIDFEQERFLEERLNFVHRMIERRQLQEPFIRDKIMVMPLPTATGETEIVYSDTLVMHSTLERLEPHIKLDVVQQVNGKFYKISLYDLIVEEDDIVESVRESMIKFYLLLTGTIMLLGVFGGIYLFKPFNRTLAQIREFKLDQGQPMQLNKSGTIEFDKLNRFLEEMTAKVQSDYNTLKEFSENASHEMQSPLANAIGKLELLLDSGRLPDEESPKVIGALDSLKHLSKMGQSLGLLAKIENREFHNKESINLSDLLVKALENFKELMDLKSLTLESQITHGVTVVMDPNLAIIMINNLLSNAIRHNIENGNINVTMDQRNLIISNSGKELTIQPELLFERFKKDRQRKDGLGLGLAIVKKICDVSGFSIGYFYEQKKHRLQIVFGN